MSRFSVNRASSRTFQRIKVYENSEIEEDNIIIDPESILADENITFEEEDIEFNYDHIKSEEIDKTIVKLGYGLDMFKKRKVEIEKLVLDNEVKSIDKRQYYNKGIKEIVLNDDLEIIEDSAFKGNKLTNIKLNSSLKIVGNSAFSDNKLENVEFNEGLEVIESHAFKNNQLTEVKLPSTLREIRLCAFKGNNIKRVFIPDNVTKIDFGAFDDDVLITYKGIDFNPDFIKIFGSDMIVKLALIKSLVPNANFNTISTNELKHLPEQPDLIKGFFNNKKRFEKLQTELDVADSFRIQDDNDIVIASEFEDYMKLCIVLGYFNTNGAKLNELENKIIEIYNTIGKSGVHKSVVNLRKTRYIKKFAEVALKNEDLSLLPQSLTAYFNRYDEISKGVIKSRENDITKLNTARRKLVEKNLDTKEIDETIKILKKNLKNYDLMDVIKYINTNTFVVSEENPEMSEIIPYLIGNVDANGFKVLEKLLTLAKKCPASNLKEFEGSKGNLSYKWLDNTDPLNLALGYIVDCCAKYNGLGEDIMIQSMTNPNLKNLVIYKDGRVIAKTTAFYNNGYILCNNVEVAHTFIENKKTTKEDLHELTQLIIEALEKQAKYLDVNEVRIGLLRNDLAQNLNCLALYIEHRDLFANYNFKNYEGDANNHICGQATVYRKRLSR